ncbi:hypothetical protein AJ80_05274 [Polytolypa hystricis UAMH7299]|uniref:Versicolorin reductase n=1 Tax=Polytolypa hystricis (strain UAMH7299) TaxID=1447883 RepID=A0A2B7Y5G8_POLH7|nr:hypothetical protein AJ80_05274 [Polytolypa hystricis UAMH7299]
MDLSQRTGHSRSSNLSRKHTIASPTYLTGKTAVVTGASKGIGRAIALSLAQRGADVVVNYLSSAQAAEEVVQSIGSDRAVAVKADVSDQSACTELVRAAVDRFQKIDILVLNAGLLAGDNSLENSSLEDFDRLFRVNEASPYIPAGGRVLFFSSSLTALSSVTPGYLLYAATKGAVEQMSRVLAKELAPRGVTVNTIFSGTNKHRDLFCGQDRCDGESHQPIESEWPHWYAGRGCVGSLVDKW